MKIKTAVHKKHCRPLRIESNDTLWFITSRTIEERFWLHPILTSGLKPPNRKARRACARLEQHCDKRLLRCVKLANAV